jgi:pimeloyl-ACP methyl ester carboxylesterase
VTTFVIVHGGWSGGWYFQDTARLMRGAGHEVYTPTLTGIGERVHLGRPDTDLDTHIQDIVNVLEYEDLRDVALVGFSYGGMVVTAVADRVPERIAQIIYLDAMVPEDGQSAADVMHVPVPSLEEVAQAAGDGWQVPHVPPQPRKTAQPIRTFIQPVVLKNPAAAGLPRSYVLFTRNSFPFAPALAEIAARAEARGWRYRELAADHTAPETHAQELADLLLALERS